MHAAAVIAPSLYRTSTVAKLKLEMRIKRFLLLGVSMSNQRDREKEGKRIRETEWESEGDMTSVDFKIQPLGLTVVSRLLQYSSIHIIRKTCDSHVIIFEQLMNENSLRYFILMQNSE